MAAAITTRERLTESESFLSSRGFKFSKHRYFALSDEFQLRDDYIERFGFAILTAEIIERLRSYSPILEVGAGSGYWAFELQQAGLDVVASDPGEERFRMGLKSEAKHWEHSWTMLERTPGQQAVVYHPNRALLMVWPSYQAAWPVEVLHAFTGSIVIYVGEGSGGCTAGDAFHELLQQDYRLMTEHGIPQFAGMHDSLMIYERLPAPRIPARVMLTEAG